MEQRIVGFDLQFPLRTINREGRSLVLGNPINLLTVLSSTVPYVVPCDHLTLSPRSTNNPTAGRAHGPDN